MVIFNSYVSLPEGTNETQIHHGYIDLILFLVPINMASDTGDARGLMGEFVGNNINQLV